MYFKKLALFGILLELVLLEYGSKGEILKIKSEYFSLHYLPYALAILVAILTKIYVGHVLDKRKAERTLGKSILFSALIFMSGILSGSLANFVFITKFSNQSLGADFYDYGVKPAMAFTYVGLPASFIVGAVYKGLMRLVKAD